MLAISLLRTDPRCLTAKDVRDVKECLVSTLILEHDNVHHSSASSIHQLLLADIDARPSVFRGTFLVDHRTIFSFVILHRVSFAFAYLQRMHLARTGVTAVLAWIVIVTTTTIFIALLMSISLRNLAW